MTVQTEDENPGPVRERVICIPSGIRPTSCTPVIVPVKSVRKGCRSKTVRKRAPTAKKAQPGTNARSRNQAQESGCGVAAGSKVHYASYMLDFRTVRFFFCHIKEYFASCPYVSVRAAPCVHLGSHHRKGSSGV